MYRRRLRATAALLVLSLTTPPLAAAGKGGDPAADALREGIAAERAGKWAQAIASLRQSIALQDGAAARYHLGVAEEASGKLPEAFADFEQAVVFAQATRQSDVLGPAQRRVAELKKRVGALRVDVRDRPGLSMLVDGGEVPASTAGRAFYVTAGSHTIDVRAPGAEPQQVSVIVEPGKQVDVTIVLRARQATLSRDPHEGEPKRAAWPYVFLGVGAVGIGVGVVYGLQAKSKRDQLKQDCPGDICPAGHEQDLLDGKFAAKVSTEGFVVGAIGLAVGGWLLVREDEKRDGAASGPRVQPYLGVGAAGLRGAF